MEYSSGPDDEMAAEFPRMRHEGRFPLTTAVRISLRD